METEKRPPNWWQKLRNSRHEEYQFVVRDVKSYRELGQYSLTPWNLYVAFASLFVLLIVFAFLLFAYTPLRHYLPGGGDSVRRAEVEEMEYLLDTLGNRLEAQALYIENLRRTIHGEAITGEDIESTGTLVDTASLEPVPLSEEEIQLRREMALERVGQDSRQAGTGLPAAGNSDVPLAQLFLVAPVNGEISAPFNPAGGHQGVDVLAAQHTAIKAARDGIVFMAEFTSANGNVIGIQHDNNLISFYKHNSQLLKKVGDRVGAGEAIAIIGNTGELTSGPHLHFELWHGGAAVDPADLIRF